MKVDSRQQVMEWQWKDTLGFGPAGGEGSGVVLVELPCFYRWHFFNATLLSFVKYSAHMQSVIMDDDHISCMNLIGKFVILIQVPTVPGHFLAPPARLDLPAASNTGAYSSWTFPGASCISGPSLQLLIQVPDHRLMEIPTWGRALETSSCQDQETLQEERLYEYWHLEDLAI